MKWLLGYSDKKEELPLNYKEVSVPTDVQLEFLQEGAEDIFFGSNFKKYEWMEDKWWHFKTTIFIEKKEGFIPVLTFKGIDYGYTIYIDGKQIIEDEGMFTPVSINLSEYEGKEIEVLALLHPIPKVEEMAKDRTQASASCIPAVSYGWDWHPRLVPIGLYDDVELCYKPHTYIEDFRIFYDITEDLSKVSGYLDVDVVNPKGYITLEIFEGEACVYKSTALCTQESRVSFEIDNPKLWWCVSQGKQNMYTLKLTAGSDSVCKKIGFRKVRLVMNAESVEGSSFPKTQSKAPITLELNGRRIFAKGTNFVPPEIFTSKLNYEIYKKQLQLVLDCNMNIIRMWGGGLVNKESFFELCDEMGIMVWQEFPLACNNYKDNDHYLKVLDKESRSIIKRLKKHPSVVMWCGGNELFCSWSGMTNQSKAIRLLDKNCYELDENTPYLQTSPLYGMGHGHYMPFSSMFTETMTDIIESDFTAYTEFGVPAPSPFEYIKKFTPEEEWYTVEPGTSWEWHHALKAWDGNENTWFCRDMIERYYGKAKTLDEIIENGVELQGEVLKHIFEEARRKWPKTSMALNWCFNEPWPSAANNSVINYPDIPKQGYYGVQAALRNQMFSVRVKKMIHYPGSTLNFEIHLLNDLPEKLKGQKFSVELSDKNGTFKRWDNLYSNEVEERSSNIILALSTVLPNSISNKFKINIICEDKHLSSEYLMFVRTPDLV